MSKDIVRESVVIGVNHAIRLTEHAIKYNHDLAWLLKELQATKAKHEKEIKSHE